MNTSNPCPANPVVPLESGAVAGEAHAYLRSSKNFASRAIPNMVEGAGRPAWLYRHRGLLTGLLFMLVAWGLYLATVRYGFVYYDDARLLLDHPELYGQPQLSSDFKEIFVKSFPREEPLVLRDVTWALDSYIFGFGNPFGYHLGNVLLHGIVVALLFVFLFGTTRRYGFALAATTAFLLLAIHTEPVAWIMGRKDILASLFMLLALCAQTRRLRAQRGRDQLAWYAVTLVCFVAGLLSKYNVLTFSVVLYLHAALFPYLSGERSVDAPILGSRALARETLLAFPSGLVSVLTYLWYSKLLAQAGGQTAHGLRHLWDVIIVDPLALWAYIQQTFFPWHLRVFYMWPGVRASYPLGQIVVSVGIIAGIAGVGIWLFRRRKDLFFYYSTFFVLMIPYMSLLNVGFWVAERYLYFAAFCLLVLAGALILPGLQSPQRIIRFGTVVVLTVFVTNNAFQHFFYQKAWQSGETLWQYHICLAKPSPTAYENLAGYYYANAAAQQGTAQSAELIHKMEIVVDAGLAEFWVDRQQSPPAQTYLLFLQKSIVQEVNGNPQAALGSLLTSIGLNPRFDATYLNLARVYRKLAHAANDPAQRQTYACAGRDQLGEYIQRAFHNLPVPPELNQEFVDMKAECSTPPQPEGAGMEPNGKVNLPR